MLTFSELQTSVQQLMERSDSNMVTRIKGFINDGYRYIANVRPWMSLLRATTFSSVASLDYFITGPEVQEVIDLSQRTTPLVLALQRYYTLLNKNFDAMILTTGNPSMASPMGEVGVATALPSDATISFASSSSADTTQSVRVRGYNASLVPVTESLTLTGTSTVTTANTYSSKEGYEPRFTKDSDTTGVITVTSSATTIALLAPAEREARYKKWKVWPAFQSSMTMYMTFKKRIYKLVNDQDTPELECDNALILFAFARCLQEKRQFQKANEVYGKKDIDGVATPGSFLAEIDNLIAREPQFSENFTDQMTPMIQRDPIDYPPGQTGYRLWPR